MNISSRSYFHLLPQEPLQSAVMLEQASYCYLFSVPQMLRKYGFHLILSGDSYKKCDQVYLLNKAAKEAYYYFHSLDALEFVMSCILDEACYSDVQNCSFRIQGDFLGSN